MKFALTLRCDGRRDYIEQTVESVNKYVRPHFSDRIIVNDSGDEKYADWLESTFLDFRCIHHKTRSGLGECFRASLEAVVSLTDADFAFMVEDDTPILAAIDMDAMAVVLSNHQNLSQLMLMRPPFNDEEIRAGGVYQLTPSEFHEKTDGTHTWVEHDRWFGFQPNLCSRQVIEYALAHATNFLELGVTDALKTAGYRFGYWGALSDTPKCAHVGHIRSAGYRW